jgi:hypothetical protein
MLEEKVLIGSYNRYKLFYQRQEAFDDDVTFMDIDDKWIDKLRAPRGKEMLAVAGILLR